MVGLTDPNSAPNAGQIRIAPDRGHDGCVWTKSSQMSATDGDMASRLGRYSRDADHVRPRGANCLNQSIGRNSQGVGIELRRASCRQRVIELALSIASA